MSNAQVNEYFEALTQFTFNEKFHFSRTVEFRENRIQKLLENLGLIPIKESVAYCECGNTFSPNINATVKLGWTWRCTGQRGCSKYTSPLKDTHFGSSNLSFFDDLQLIYCFTEGMSVTKAIETTKTKERTHGAQHVVARYQYLRAVCDRILDQEPIVIGGRGMPVMLDETHLFTNKYHSGRPTVMQDKRIRLRRLLS